jgi:hypothetical protein
MVIIQKTFLFFISFAENLESRLLVFENFIFILDVIIKKYKCHNSLGIKMFVQYKVLACSNAVITINYT